MIKEAYDLFFENVSTQFKNNLIIQSFIHDAEELALYGERRIALENFLENIIENKISISDEAVALAEKSFSDAPNNLDAELINELKDKKY